MLILKNVRNTDTQISALRDYEQHCFNEIQSCPSHTFIYLVNINNFINFTEIAPVVQKDYITDMRILRTINNDTQCQEVINQNEFAIYSYNFGNFRNELSKNKKQLAKIASYGIDAYFFTDNFDFNMKGWHTIHMKTDASQNGIPAARLTGKRLKFKGHSNLQKYRYLIHVDSDPGRLNVLIKWLNNGLIQFVKAHPEKSLFVSQHTERQTIQEEVWVLKIFSWAQQPRHQLDAWDKFLMPKYSELNKIRLPETHTWVRDTNDKTLSQKWASMYDTLIERGLWRDQIVYSYVIGDSVKSVYMVERDSPDSFKTKCAFPSIMRTNKQHN